MRLECHCFHVQAATASGSIDAIPGSFLPCPSRPPMPLLAISLSCNCCNGCLQAELAGLRINGEEQNSPHPAGASPTVGGSPLLRPIRTGAAAEVCALCYASQALSSIHLIITRGFCGGWCTMQVHFIIAGSGGMRLLQSRVQALTVQPAMLQSSKASPFWERATSGEPAAVATSAAAHMQHAGIGVNPWPPPPVRPR